MGLVIGIIVAVVLVLLAVFVIAGYNGQHRGIFSALNERDAVTAQALITEHLEKARDDLLRANSP